jgi:hypothetical protein
MARPAGDIANIPFLTGGTKGPNAQTAVVYSTFWQVINLDCRTSRSEHSESRF